MFRFFRRKARVAEIERTCTPLEILAAARRGEIALRDVVIGEVLAREPATGFHGHRIASGAMFYSRGSGARGIVIVFTGRTLQPMVPVSVLLQLIDDRALDVLLLADVRELHFEQGLAPFGDDLLSLARGLRAFVDEGGYDTVFTHGVSMGGLPALRVGRLMRAHRAISIGGRFAWHVNRLLQAGAPAVPAFDLLCPCTRAQTELQLHFGLQQEKDRRTAEMVKRRLPEAEMFGVDYHKHNVIHHLFERGELRQFYAGIFDPRTLSRR